MRSVESIAVLDACVLVPASLRDTLLRLAEAGSFRPAWSDEILSELKRTLESKIGLRPKKAAYLDRELRRTFPDAAVSGYELLLRKVTNEEKDRHVLAAAAKAGAKHIVTFNKRHFPLEATRPWGIEGIGPADFLETIYSRQPELVLTKLHEQAANLGRTTRQQLDVLYKTVRLSLSSLDATDQSVSWFRVGKHQLLYLGSS